MNFFKMSKYFQLIFKIIMFLLGLSVIIWMLWSRFIRERLPKDIPFNLNEIWFYLLLYVCFIYLYIVIKLLFPRKPNPLVAKIVDYLYTPLIIVDETIKNNKYFADAYEKILNIFMHRFTNLKFKDMIYIYVCYTVVPRLPLVIILCFDIFIMQRLELIYAFVLLNIFSLTHRYIKYSLKYAKTQSIKKLSTKYPKVTVLNKNYENPDWEDKPKEERDEDLKYHQRSIPFEEYLNLQVESYFNVDYNHAGYEGFCLPNKDIRDQYMLEVYGDKEAKLTTKDFDFMHEQFDKEMLTITNLSINLEMYSIVSSISAIRYTKASIFGIYFICWSYVITVSFHKVQKFIITNKVLEWLQVFLDKIEPFSGLFL